MTPASRSLPSADTRTAPRLTLAILSLAGLAYAFGQSVVLPALPEIQQRLGTTEEAVSWLLTGYLLTASVATPIVGRLGDIYGKERVLIVVLALFVGSSLLGALAGSIGVMIVSRMVSGIGAGVFPLAFGIIRDEFPRERVPGSIGLMSGLLGVGGGAAIVLAGVVTDHLSYHWLFWLPLVLSALALVMTIRYIPESPVRAPSHINWRSAALLSLGLVGVLLAISRGAAWGWASGRTIGLLAAGLVVLGLWIWSEIAAREPLVDMRMMRIRGVWTTNLSALLIGVGMYSAFSMIPQLVQSDPAVTGVGFGASVTEAGLMLLPAPVMMLTMSFLAGPVEERVGSKPPLVAGGVFALLGYALLAVGYEHKVVIYVASGFQGIGIGFAFAAMANLIVENVSADQTGVATGMNTVMRSLGGAVGAQITAAIIIAGFTAQGVATAGSYSNAIWFNAAASLVAVVVSLIVPNRRPADMSEPGPELLDPR